MPVYKIAEDGTAAWRLRLMFKDQWERGSALPTWRNARGGYHPARFSDFFNNQVVRAKDEGSAEQKFQERGNVSSILVLE